MSEDPTPRRGEGVDREVRLTRGTQGTLDARNERIGRAERGTITGWDDHLWRLVAPEDCHQQARRCERCANMVTRTDAEQPKKTKSTKGGDAKTTLRV